MAASTWKLESFLDSLILELDRAQDTLSLKGMSRKLTYTVKDIGLDLHIFPEYRDGEIYFKNAKSGDNGASRISFQLGSISDRQIKETTKDPISKDDISIDEVEGLGDDVKRSLRKIGVSSARDIEKLDERNVDLEKAVNKNSDAPVKYNELANLIRSSRRKKTAPSLSRIQSAVAGEDVLIRLAGKHLHMAQEAGFPYGEINEIPIQITHADSNAIEFSVPKNSFKAGENKLALALDSYAVLELNLNQGGSHDTQR